MAIEFTLPDWLKGNSADEVHKRMMDELPTGIDKGEGGFPWDFTRPTALEKAYMVEFILTEAIKNLFPLWAYGVTLDHHGETRGIYRRPAAHSTVELTVTGEPETVIPAGFQVSTEATLEDPSVIFTFDEETTIPESGTVTATVTAVESGIIGNVVANSIILQVKPLNGIKTLTNEEASYGGFAEEDDDTLRERIMEYDAEQGHSFVGSNSDYKRWAMSVIGVGSCKVTPARDDTGLIKLTITDANGQPADEDLCTAVYNYIMSPDAEYERRAPINANLQVVAPTALNITVKVGYVVLESGYTLDGVKETFVENMLAYFASIEDNTIRYNDVSAVFVNTKGVLDYKPGYLTLNSGTDNITIDEDEMPIISADMITLSAGNPDAQ